MAILVYNGKFDSVSWAEALKQYLPDEDVHIYPDIPSKEAIEFAAVWDHPVGDLATYPNLKAIMILGAGGDFLMKDNQLPDVPIVRLVDPVVAKDMAQHCWYWVTHFYRRFDTYRTQQARAQWQRLDYPLIEDYRVGILGLGAIGQYVVKTLQADGYALSAWFSSPREQKGVKVYGGDDQLADFMGELDVLVNILPLTENTRGFLNRQRLSLLPRGAKLINISRGAVVDDSALLELLYEGHLGGAALDVFAEEPLPPNHELWQHPLVNITPHSSGQTYVRSAIKCLVANIQRIQRGEEAFPLFDKQRGY